MHKWKEFYRQLGLLPITCLVLLLCLPAFLLNLDTIAFIADEGIRTLVAFEMKLSGNYIVPTFNGEEYFNKPPLYNWFIVGMSTLFGYFGEWPSRLTTLVFLGAFAWTCFYYGRKYFDMLTGIILALMLITCGRILFWDSMLGLIDICFSWIIYLNFMILYSLGKSGKWQKMFLWSYLLFSVAFLLKGLPAAVFQGISIVTALVYHKTFKSQILSRQHLLGIAIGILPALAYYALYASHVSLENVFSVLFEQSMQRTATHHGFGKTIVHLFTFPFEQLYHFLPWSILAAIFFHPKARAWIRQHPFVHFNFWMLAANLPVYWISVEVYPRYLLMFVPLFNCIVYFLVQQSKMLSLTWWNIFRVVFLALASLATGLTLVMIVDKRIYTLQGMPYYWIASSLVMLFVFGGLALDAHRTFLWMGLSLLVIRIIFNFTVLPHRQIDNRWNICRENSQRVAKLYGDKPWRLYKDTFLNETATCYTSIYTGQIIRQTDTVLNQQAYYLVNREWYPDFPGHQIDSVILQSGRVIPIMRLSPDQ